MIEIIPNWHPIFVHFTVALISTAIGFFLLAKLLGNRPFHEQCLILARWNLWIGTGFAVITVATGILAYNSVAHDTPSHAAMTEHRNWAFATFAVLLLTTLWYGWIFYANKLIKLPFLAIAVLLLGLLFSTAWHGGELVYRYGLGRRDPHYWCRHIALHYVCCNRRLIFPGKTRQNDEYQRNSDWTNHRLCDFRVDLHEVHMAPYRGGAQRAKNPNR